MLHFRKKVVVLSLLFLTSFEHNAHSAIMKLLFNNEASNANALTFLSSTEQRKKQLEDLNKTLNVVTTKAHDDNKVIVAAINSIDNRLKKTKDQLSVDGKQKEEFLNKKISILNDHKQSLLTRQELVKESPEIIRQHIELIKETITFLQGKEKKALKSVYSWKEFRKAQNEENELLEKIEQEKNKKENLEKQLSSEKEAISSLKKQVSVKEKEHEKIVATLKTTSSDDTTNIRQQRELLEEEILLVKEKVATTSQKITRHNYDVHVKDDRVDLLQSMISNKKELLVTIEKRLVLEVNDIEIARAEANDESQQAFSTKESLNKKIEVKKRVRNQLEPRIHFLKKRIDQLKNNPKATDRHHVDVNLLEANLTKQQSLLKNVERSISLLSARKELAEAYANQKDITYQNVDLRYKLSRGKHDLDELLAKFKNQKDIEQNILKKLQEYHKEATRELITAHNELELIKLQTDSIKEKDDLFRKYPEAQKKILRYIEATKKSIDEQLQVNNKYLAINADLISSREKIINQYSLIIQHIETHKLLQGVWKRSPKAITFEEFKRSWIEAETFFSQFFWDTPTYLGPASLLKSIKQTNMDILISILLFFVFFLISYLVLRRLLFIMLTKAKRMLSSESKRIGFLPLNIIIELLEFARNNFTVIFTWFFISLHIIFRFQYCFSTIDFLNNRYYITMFHLLTIPVLVNLSRNMLASIKELNRRLSFLFFAEKLQDKFILLITCFCYSTAIFIPLRFAFLTYFHHSHTVFQDVLLAAYSLTLVVVLLLFFSKEDVLRIIPSGRGFLRWIKRQIDQHYYPVFFFFMGLLILSNPYIGYSNMAWYLAFAIPCSTLLVYAVFLIHYYIRKYAVFMFMKEDEEEIIDKFEHAKTYYGVFVIFSFLALCFVTFIFIARIWQYNYAPDDIWKLLSDIWVIPIGTKDKLGFIEVSIVGLFVIGGFLMSSLLNKFILNKLYDILRTEPGTQNTVSKILHYLLISFATCLGVIYIRLESFIWYLGTLLAVGLGFALKDILTDYVAGFFVLIERPIEIGSFIRLDHHPHMLGTIHKIDARTTTIMTRLNHAIIVPNKDLINKPIVNWGKGRFAVGFEMRITVDYDSDPELVRTTIMEVIQNNPTILRVPNITVRLEDFEESAFYFMARAFISSRRVKEGWDIAAAIRQGIVIAFRQRGIQFAFPQHVVHMNQRKSSTDNNTDNDNSSKSPIEINFDRA